MTEAATQKKPKRRSRSQQWFDAVSDCKSALETIRSAADELEAAAATLRGVQEEYEAWKDNLPENLASSPLGEKLEEVCNLEIESMADNLLSAVDEAEGTLDDAEGMALPQGFGRD